MCPYKDGFHKSSHKCCSEDDLPTAPWQFHSLPCYSTFLQQDANLVIGQAGATINVTVYAKTSLVHTKIEINFITPAYSYIH